MLRIDALVALVISLYFSAAIAGGTVLVAGGPVIARCGGSTGSVLGRPVMNECYDTSGWRRWNRIRFCSS